jgi:hypothetical protein
MSGGISMKRFTSVVASLLVVVLAMAGYGIEHSEGTVAQVYFIKAKPGKMEEYNRYIREVAGPIDEAAKRNGAYLSLTTLISTKPDSPWTHMRIFVLKDRAQLTNLQKALDNAKLKLEPDAARRKARDDYAATLRDFVSSEVLDVFR